MLGNKSSMYGTEFHSGFVVFRGLYISNELLVQLILFPYISVTL